MIKAGLIGQRRWVLQEIYESDEREETRKMPNKNGNDLMTEEEIWEKMDDIEVFRLLSLGDIRLIKYLRDLKREKKSMDSEIIVDRGCDPDAGAWPVEINIDDEEVVALWDSVLTTAESTRYQPSQELIELYDKDLIEDYLWMDYLKNEVALFNSCEDLDEFLKK